jgi:hypothetical protein
MAIEQYINNQAKWMALDAMSKDVFKIALFISANANITRDTTTYTVGMAGELPTANGYTQGGIVMPGSTVSGSTGSAYDIITDLTADVVYAQFRVNPSWSSTSLSGVDSAVIYNASRGNKILGGLTFAAVSTTGGTLTVILPASSAATALLAFTNGV